MKNYKELMELLRQYKKTKIWELVSGDDVFQIAGYKKPVFVSILGQSKTCTDLNFFYGKEELYSQYDQIYGEYANYPDLSYRISCYKLIIDDPEPFLHEEEKKQLKKEHIKSDICAIRLETGKRPRLISEEEAGMLLPILKDLLKIIEYIKKEQVKFPEKIQLDTQYKFSVEEDKVSHKKVKFTPGYTLKIKEEKLDEDILNKVLIFSQSGTFGVALFYGPFYIGDENEYSRLLVVTDLETGKILDMQVFPIRDENNLANYLLASFLKIKRYPKNIAFASTKDFLRCQRLIPELKMNYKVDTNMGLLFEQWIELYNNVNGED